MVTVEAGALMTRASLFLSTDLTWEAAGVKLVERWEVSCWLIDSN